MTVEETVALFLRWCKQHRKPATVRFYTGRLKPFRQKWGSTPFADLTPPQIFEYLVDVGENVSDSTRRHNAVALETLQGWALNQKILKARIFEKLEKPRMGRRELLPTAEDTRRLLEHASVEFCRIYTALRLCGARPGELCKARLEDWDRQAGCLVITDHKTARKTGQARRIPVSQKLAAILLESTRGHFDGPLFRSPSGQPWTRENLSQTYARLRNNAGLSPELVLYLARHEVGTELCRTKGIEVARRVLGHSNLSTTQRYVHLNDGELAKACEGLGDKDPDPPPQKTAPKPTAPRPKTADQPAPSAEVPDDTPPPREEPGTAPPA